MFKNGNKLCGITTYQIKLLNNIGFEWKVDTIRSSASPDGQCKDTAIYLKRFGKNCVPQQLSEIHLMNAGSTRKEEIINKVKNAKVSLGKIKMIEFSC